MTIRQKVKNCRIFWYVQFAPLCIVLDRAQTSENKSIQLGREVNTNTILYLGHFSIVLLYNWVYLKQNYWKMSLDKKLDIKPFLNTLKCSNVFN